MQLAFAATVSSLDNGLRGSESQLTERRPRTRSVVAAALLFHFCTGCAGTIPWDVPMRQPNPRANSRDDLLLATDAPEVICYRVRAGAADRREVDTWSGIPLALVGAGVASTGIALAAKADDKGGIAGWSAMAGAGTALLGIGIYFLTRGGDDRQEYWATNAAVAQSRADYSVASSRNYVADTAIEEKVGELAKEKSKAQMDFNNDTNAVTFAEAQLKAAQDAAKPGDHASAVKLFSTNPATDVKAAHDALTDAAAKLESATDEWTLAANELSARQAAWNHCATALQAIGSVDATANSAFAAALGASAGSASKGSGGGGSNTGGGGGGK
jgi:hypothetical protein